MPTYEFYLEGGVIRTICVEKNIHEMAKHLQEQEAGGYVYDINVIIPVRRIVAVSLLPADEPAN